MSKYLVDTTAGTVTDFTAEVQKTISKAKQVGYEQAKAECEDCPKAKDCTKCEHVYSAYQDGLNDFSEAIKKISNMRVPDRLEIFGTQYTENCLETHTPSKIFEKIRQYEQRQEEQDGLRQNIQTIVDQCGYSLDEIAEVLRKMKDQEETT